MGPSGPPPPFIANAILNFHFDFLTPSLMLFADHSAAPLDVYYSRRTPGCPALQVIQIPLTNFSFGGLDFLNR